MTGRVHSIESFGLVDGPGVRCVVFLKGCCLRCRYCHNPDTWSMDGGEEWEAEDLFRKIYRFRPYWKNNGGITVSGGEALLQMEFVTELFTIAKSHGVHTTLDTSGAPFRTDDAYLEKFQKLMDVTDLFLLDIKEMNRERHLSLTGQDNQNILSLAQYLSDHGKAMWVRHVLVPGITDFEEDLKALEEFLDTLETVEKREILPYHTLGIYKWENLGIPYSLHEVLPPTQEEIQRAEKILSGA